jgi:hypothetical protein
VLTSFLLSLSQTALIITTITVIRNVTAPLAKTIATATVIVEIGIRTVAGETETTVNAILTVIGNAQTVVTAIGIATETVNVVVIVTKDARASRKNVDGSSRAKTTDVDHSVARTRGAPLVVPAAAAAASATVARQIAVHPHLWARSRSRNGSVRPVVGTSMHLAMSSTLPCRRNKPVRITLFGIRCICHCC